MIFSQPCAAVWHCLIVDVVFPKKPISLWALHGGHSAAMLKDSLQQPQAMCCVFCLVLQTPCLGSGHQKDTSEATAAASQNKSHSPGQASSMACCRHILIWDARFLMDAEAPEGSSVVQMAPIFDCSLPAGMTIRAMLGTGNTWTVATDEGGLLQVGQCYVLP